MGWTLTVHILLQVRKITFHVRLFELIKSSFSMEGTSSLSNAADLDRLSGIDEASSLLPLHSSSELTGNGTIVRLMTWSIHSLRAFIPQSI